MRRSQKGLRVYNSQQEPYAKIEFNTKLLAPGQIYVVKKLNFNKKKVNQKSH